MATRWKLEHQGQMGGFSRCSVSHQQ